jgi:hypothetical protein
MGKPVDIEVAPERAAVWDVIHLVDCGSWHDDHEQLVRVFYTLRETRFKRSRAERRLLIAAKRKPPLSTAPENSAQLDGV